MAITSVRKKSANRVGVVDALDEKMPEGLIGAVLSSNVFLSDGRNAGNALGGDNCGTSGGNGRAIEQLKSGKTSKSKEGFEHGQPNHPAGLFAVELRSSETYGGFLVASGVDIGDQQAYENEKQSRAHNLKEPAG